MLYRLAFSKSRCYTALLSPTLENLRCTAPLSPPKLKIKIGGVTRVILPKRKVGMQVRNQDLRRKMGGGSLDIFEGATKRKSSESEPVWNFGFLQGKELVWKLECLCESNEETTSASAEKAWG